MGSTSSLSPAFAEAWAGCPRSPFLSRAPGTSALQRITAALCTLLAFAGAAPADEPPTLAPPAQREIWVPTKQLAEVLARYPRAIMLSREQYDTLLHDARAAIPKPSKPPQDAALTSSAYTAHIEGKSLVIDGDLTVEVLTNSWAQLPLTFASVFLGEIQIDGEAALQPSLATPETTAPTQSPTRGKQDFDAKPPTQPTILLLRGHGTHHLKLKLTTPITAESGSSRVDFRIPHAGAASFKVTLPPHTHVETQLPAQVHDTPDATLATIALSPASSSLALEWSHPLGVDSPPLPPSARMLSAYYTVDSENVRLQTELDVSTALGDLPETLDFTVLDPANVLQFTGHDVAAWTATPGRVSVSLRPGHRSETRIEVVLTQPSLAGANRASVSLALPSLAGNGRTSGNYSIKAVDGIAVPKVITSAAPYALPQAVAYPPYRIIGSWEFSDAPAIEIIVENLKPRFNADLDTLVEFEPEAVFIERTISLHPEEGRLFSLTAAIPAGEELLSVRSGALEPNWRLEGEKRDRLIVRWNGEDENMLERSSPETVTPPLPRVVSFRTRLEPKGWNALGPDGLTVALQDARIEGAERVSGYVALRAGEDFRLEANAPDSLELRDGRTTPIHSDYAWFRREEMALGVKVMRRPAEITATLSGYALPLAGVLDIHAQLAWKFRRSGVRSIKVKTPAAIAAQFHFDGPQIAERTLSGDTWTITFQKEITGDYDLTATVQTPVAKLPDDPSRFQTEVPLIEPLNTQHAGGTWAIEANTDTEVTLTAEGMNELDAQLAPVVRDYQPRHRVIGVFTWLGDHYALRLEGVRHAPGKVLTTVADQVILVSVVSPSGSVRTQAALQLRTIGEQFLDVTLPPAAKLLSLSRNGNAIKPVEGEPGNVRVELTAGAASNIPINIGLLYETAGDGEWSAEGKGNLPALHLPLQVPILRSEWRVYLPDGFYFDRVKSNLEKAEEPHALPLLFAPWRALQSDSLYFLWSALSRAPISDEYEKHRQEVYLATPTCSTPAPSAMIQSQTRPLGTATAFQVEKGWDRPVHKFGSMPGADFASAHANLRLQHKLDAIIIPRLVFREASLREAIDFLKAKSVSLDTDETEPARRGVNIVFKLESNAQPSAPAIPGLERIPDSSRVQTPDEHRITLDLTNIPLGEALKYVTGLANLRFKVEQYAVSILPIGTPTEVLITKEWIVPPGFLSAPPDLDLQNAPPAGRQGGTPGPRAVTSVEAKDYLAASGVTFPPGASALFIPNSAKLIVRNTEENLNLIDTLVEPAGVEPPIPKLYHSADELQTIGLLPLELDLPISGREVRFQGLTAPDHVTFHFISEWTRARRLWLWFVAGAPAALLFAGRRPGWRTCWVVLLCTAISICLSPASTAPCNAFLLGWLTALILRRLARWLAWSQERKAVLA